MAVTRGVSHSFWNVVEHGTWPLEYGLMQPSAKPRMWTKLGTVRDNEIRGVQLTSRFYRAGHIWLA